MRARWWLTPLALLLGCGCAVRRPILVDLKAGQLGPSTWKDCRITSVSTVVCACSTFDVTVDGKTGNSLLRCAKP